MVKLITIKLFKRLIYDTTHIPKVKKWSNYPNNSLFYVTNQTILNSVVNQENNLIHTEDQAINIIELDKLNKKIQNFMNK